MSQKLGSFGLEKCDAMEKDQFSILKPEVTELFLTFLTNRKVYYRQKGKTSMEYLILSPISGLA